MKWRFGPAEFWGVFHRPARSPACGAKRSRWRFHHCGVSTALICGLPFALGLLGNRRLGMHLSLALLGIHRAARLGAFGLLRSCRLALHLALSILR